MPAPGHFRTLALLSLFFTTAAAAQDLQFYPPKIELSGARDSQSFCVQQRTGTQLTQDITDQVQVRVADESIARIAGHKVLPVSNGTTKLLVKTAADEFEVPVVVTDATDDGPLSFRLDVVPVLTKTGCNSGRCHGAARGKDGFQLSLYGFDPKGDYHRLVEELPGRRINTARPAASLLLTKGTGNAPHTGGERFTDDSDYYQTLERWIREGATDDKPNVEAAVGIRVYPRDIVMSGKDRKQPLVVVADYSDGTTRDVTRLAAFISNNDNSASVSEEGVVTSGERGEAFIMARFESFTEGIPVIALPSDVNRPKSDEIPKNYVDELVTAKLQKLAIEPSAVCSDEEFLRRVSIDLAGLTPTEKQYADFLADDSADKRERLIDHLLEQDEFVDLWAMKLGEMLKIRTANQVSYKALLGFHNWVREQIRQDMPVNELLAAVIQAEGGTFDSPATNFYQIEANNRLLAENVAQSFFGMRIQCAQCHNHPFDRWTMDDYYGFTAFFSRIGFKQSNDPREYIVHELDQGETYHVVDNRKVAPKFLGGDMADTDGEKRRAVLASWISDSDNPYVASNLVNFIWAHHFGRGIVEPVDDVRISNPPVNEPLLRELAMVFRESGFNLKTVVRDICVSNTYQRSTTPNATNKDDFTNFSKAAVRRIRAEVLLDSVSRITDTKDRFSRLPEGARSVQIADGAVSNYFLSTFGRADRETVCSCEVDVVPTLSQAFHLINGETTNEKIVEGQVIDRLLQEGLSTDDILRKLYIRCYSRTPTQQEIKAIKANFESDDLQQELVDVFWSLLNSKEFIFNH